MVKYYFKKLVMGFFSDTEHLNMSYLPNRVKEYILSKNKHLKKPLEKF